MVIFPDDRHGVDAAAFVSRIRQRRGVEDVKPRKVPDDVEIEIAELGDERLAIISWPVVPAKLPSLTTAEEEVLRALARGQSNSEIAKARGTTTRTVANQVASLLRKFNVASRHELIVAISRPELS